jgi:SAM-dependent methyltransferase
MSPASTDFSMLPLSLPHPTDRARQVEWNGQTFDVDGSSVRVLAYDVSPSGWTEELTHLHEEVGKSDHFIDVASRRHAVAEVTRCATRVPSVVLEIGSSSGFLLRDLLKAMPNNNLVVGSDYTRGTLETVGRELPGVPLVQFDLTKCPLPDAFADVVVLLNVLEHIRDHQAAVEQLFRIIRPGGAVIIEVPAASSLFDVYDRVLMHERRYDMPDLVKLMESAGFLVEDRSHLGFLLFPAFYIVKRLNQLHYPLGSTLDEQALVGQMIASTRKSSPLMNVVMGLEGKLQSLFALPWGVRCLVTCRKPS